MLSRRFLKVSSELYRGPQPSSLDLLHLSALGVKAVFNLREESVDSRAIALGSDLAYHHIPVEDWTVPTHEQVEEFLTLLAQPRFRPALVHCWGGVGRTGVFVCCYRIRQGMDYREAIALSDRETPHLQMNAVQRDFIRRFAAE